MAPRIFAIDPGSRDSAWVVYDADAGKPVLWRKQANLSVIDALINDVGTPSVLAVESVASYGMRVGAEVFETCVWAGRFIQAWAQSWGEQDYPWTRVYRRDVKLHLLGRSHGNDADVRAALIDRFAPGFGGRSEAIGTKANPGPLHGFRADCWSALGVAITAAETAVQVAS